VDIDTIRWTDRTFTYLFRAGTRNKPDYNCIGDLRKSQVLANFTSYSHDFSFSPHAFSDVYTMAFGVHLELHAKHREAAALKAVQ
jgi:hypothetical protein